MSNGEDDIIMLAKILMSGSTDVVAFPAVLKRAREVATDLEVGEWDSVEIRFALYS